MKYDYAISVLQSEQKEFYITLELEKELKSAIEILKGEEGEVIFKAKLKKGENLSKVIEQVLYPKYMDKEIIIREVKQ